MVLLDPSKNGLELSRNIYEPNMISLDPPKSVLEDGTWIDTV